MYADQVHAIVPVARSHQRQTVLPVSQAVANGARAVFVKARRFAGAPRLVVIRFLIRAECAPLEEMYALIEHIRVAGDLDVPAGGERKPEVVVRTTGAYAAAKRRMPPVQDIAFRKLLCRAPKQVFADQARLRVRERHGILQLVAEAECAAGLVVAAAAPESARQRLVQEPAIREHVHARVGRRHLAGPERAVPVRADSGQRRARRTETAQQVCATARVSDGAHGPKAEDDLPFFAVGELEWHLEGTAGIERRAYPAGQARPAQRIWIRVRAVP